MEKHTRKNIYNGSPLQYSCLENPRDGGAWRAAVCGVEESDSTEAARQQQMRNCLALLYNRNKHNTVSQLYFSNIKEVTLYVIHNSVGYIVIIRMVKNKSDTRNV